MFPRGNRPLGTPRDMPRYATSLLLVATVPVLAACGGSSPSSQQALASTKQADAIAFASCMRSHGVPNFPDPSGNGSVFGPGRGIDSTSPQFQRALQACKSLAP